MSSADLEALLNQAVDGELSPTDEALLQQLLQDDAAALRRYLHFMQLHADLHWDHGAASSLLVNAPGPSAEFAISRQESGGRTAGWMTRGIALGTVAATLLLAIVYFGSFEKSASSAPAIVHVEMVQGTVSFQSFGSELRVSPNRENALPAGTLLVEGESSAAQWRFRDGTRITVSGAAEVSFSDEGQKILRVRQGMLTAEVQPQPTGAPLVVETPTARVEVVGTVFTLAAEAEQTRVNVNEGIVRMKRLVDGRTVEVPRDKHCLASLDARDELRLEVSDEPISGWEHRFTQPPPERWKAEWLPAEGKLPARVRAVPCMVGRKHAADDTPIVHYGVTARKVESMDLGSLPAAGALRFRFRTQQAARLQIMLGLNRADGRFGGNFEAKVPPVDGPSHDDGWKELVLPLEDFRPLVSRYPVMAENARPYLILITTYEQDAGLEISELAIIELESIR